MTPRRAYTGGETAQSLSLNVRSLRYLMEMGKLKPVQIRLAQALGIQLHDIWPDKEPTA